MPHPGMEPLLGGALSRLLRASEVIECVKDLVAREPVLLLCRNPRCVPCAGARRILTCPPEGHHHDGRHLVAARGEEARVDLGIDSPRRIHRALEGVVETLFDRQGPQETLGRPPFDLGVWTTNTYSASGYSTSTSSFMNLA
jgi:hypothetical protein